MSQLWDGGTMMMNKYRNESSIDIWQHKYRSGLDWGRIKGGDRRKEDVYENRQAQ